MRDRLELVRPATVLAALVSVQATLGAMTVLSGLNVWINSVHVVCGALLLATSLVLTLRAWRGSFADRAAVQLVTDPSRIANPAAVGRTSPAILTASTSKTSDDRRGRLQPDPGVRA